MAFYTARAFGEVTVLFMEMGYIDSLGGGEGRRGEGGKERRGRVSGIGEY